MVFSSKLIEDAVAEFAKLPGIGKKTALRMVLHLLKTDVPQTDAFANAIVSMRHNIRFCSECHNVSDGDKCNICSNPARNRSQICVVESLRDVIAIESTQQYNGLYHLLGGILSPLDGIGPEQLNIQTLSLRIQNNGVEELIMALSPTIEGDTTVYYITKQIAALPVRITTIARGIAFGGELEYADEVTLAKSIAQRLPLNSYMNSKP
jgi:recombination protein RecR